MIYKNIVDSARQYCIERSREYLDQYMQDNCTGTSLYKNAVVEELLYWVETAVDVDYISAIECKRALISFVDKLQKFLSYPPDDIIHKVVDGEKQHFIEYMSTIEETCDAIDLPYNRTVVGEEKDEIKRQLANRWNYVTDHYWNPLSDSTKRENLFIMRKYLTKHYIEIRAYVMQNFSHVYRYGEGLIEPQYCSETSVLDFNYNGLEIMYFDKDFSWVIYLSHEETITFSGTLLPIIKSLLNNEQDKWNKFESD
jgi:hypothetical protein